MNARPDDLRIDDLAAPVYAPEVRAMMAAAVAMMGPLPLAAEPLLAAAVEQTGLDDFGAAAFRERLEVLLAALASEGGLSPFGRVNFTAILSQLLRNRLLIEDLVARQPEILAIPIARPIVVAGLQRTGTTHLHNLLSADPRLRHLPFWESLEPVPAPGESGSADATDPRWQRCALALDFQHAAMPHFERMHEMTVEHAHEEIQLLAIDFSTMLFEALVPLPSWRDYYLARDQTPHYAYLKKVLQVLTWLRGGARWVLKSPQHIEQLGPLIATFPDATVVLTHRDPVSVVASTATMLAYGNRMTRQRIDPRALGAYWADRTERMLRACARDRALVPAAQSMDVLFADYMRDDMAVVRRLYALAGQPLKRLSLAAMGEYMRAHPRGRFGRVEYKLADFGLDADELRERFRFYTDHFGVAAEATAL